MPWAAAAGLVGLGVGLTPSGDDFLVGYLAALRCRAGREAGIGALLRNAAVPLDRVIVHTHAISRQMLSDALDGRFSESLIDVVCAIRGAGDVVTAVANRRLLGPGWSSRILQAVLLEMLDDEPTIVTVANARLEYARRRRLVGAVLESHDVVVTGTDGINLWMAVADERSALVTLAAQGIGAAPGEPFQVRHDSPHLRVTVGLIESDHEGIATQLAASAGGSRSPRGHR